VPTSKAGAFPAGQLDPERVGPLRDDRQRIVAGLVRLGLHRADRDAQSLCRRIDAPLDPRAARDGEHQRRHVSLRHAETCVAVLDRDIARDGDAIVARRRRLSLELAPLIGDPGHDRCTRTRPEPDLDFAAGERRRQPLETDLEEAGGRKPDLERHGLPPEVELAPAHLGTGCIRPQDVTTGRKMLEPKAALRVRLRVRPHSLRLFGPERPRTLHVDGSARDRHAQVRPEHGSLERPAGCSAVAPARSVACAMGK